MNNLLEVFDQIQISKLSGKEICDFSPGDTVDVSVNLYENGAIARVQHFIGICIARSNRGLHSSFIVRKITLNEGVERRFLIYSPCVKSVALVKRGRVRRAKLYYLRNLTGKAARVPERFSFKGKEKKK